MFANLAADSMQGRRMGSPGSLKAREYSGESSRWCPITWRRLRGEFLSQHLAASRAYSEANEEQAGDIGTG